MTRPIQALRADYAQRGYLAPATAAEARVLAADLMARPAYHDAKDPEHRTLIEDVSLFYSAIVPEAE